VKLFVDGEEIELDVPEGNVVQAGDRLLVKTALGTHSALVVRQGDELLISYRGRQYSVTERKIRVRSGAAIGSGELMAPMPGQIVDIRSEVGDAVTKGQIIVVLEAMKTQQPFTAPFDGHVESVPVEVGQLVAEGALLAKIVSVQVAEKM